VEPSDDRRLTAQKPALELEVLGSEITASPYIDLGTSLIIVVEYLLLAGCLF
jgi:hypothetical protein